MNGIINNKLLITAIFIMGIIAYQVQSEETVCTGKVEQLSYHAENSFLVKLSSINTTMFSATLTQCRNYS